MVHDDYKEMIPARSLASLDASDDRLLSEHLATCADCRRELDEWNAVAASLALSAPAQEPSPSVRTNILLTIASEKPQATRANVVPFNAARRSVWTSLGSFGAIAAALLFVVLGASVFVLWRENSRLKSQLAQQTTRMDELDQRVAQQQRMVQQFTAPGTTMVELRPTSAAPGAKAMVAVDKDGRATLLARGLPSAPPGKAYQVWYIVGNKPMPGRVFRMDSAGNGLLEDQMPPVAVKAAVIAITMETEQGAAAPTGAILLSSSL